MPVGCLCSVEIVCSHADVEPREQDASARRVFAAVNNHPWSVGRNAAETSGVLDADGIGKK